MVVFGLVLGYLGEGLLLMDLLVLIDVGYLGCLFVGWVRWLRLLACYDVQNFVK